MARGRVTLRVTIPANTTALVFVPARNSGSVTESGVPVAKASAVSFVRMEAGAAIFAVGSGDYTFIAKL